jgi:hypothetical protein
MEMAKKLSLKHNLQIRYIPWQIELADVTGPDSVLIVERLHVSTDTGDNGHRPVTRWEFSSAPPKWLKFADGATTEVSL